MLDKPTSEMVHDLDQHRAWVDDDATGQRLDWERRSFIGYDLRGVDLSEAVLSRADLRGAAVSESENEETP